RGALEVILPIDSALARSEAGARNITLVIGLSLLGLLGVLAFIAQRFIFSPLQKMAAAAKAISAGDIDQRIDHTAPDEIGELAGAFRGSVDYLRSVAGAADALRRGDLSVKVEPRGDRDVLSQSFRQLQETIHGLIAETQL